MELKHKHPETLHCWRCGAYPATKVRPWRLYLLNYDRRTFTDNALAQITTVDMPLCSHCEAQFKKGKERGWIIGLIGFGFGFLLTIIMTLAGVFEVSIGDALKIGVVFGLFFAIVSSAIYTKSFRRKSTGFHPELLHGHPVYGFFYDYGWRDNHFEQDSLFDRRYEDDYRVAYVNYLQWLQTTLGYQVYDDRGRYVDLSTPEFAGPITLDVARKVSINFEKNTGFKAKNVHNLRQSSQDWD